MSALNDTLNQIVSTHKLPHHESLTNWFIDLPRRGSLTCQVVTGDDALEWYFTVYDQADGKEVWSDWMDYLGYHDGKTEAELIEDKGRDLSTFVEAWLRATDARITKTKYKFIFKLFSFTLTNLELCLEGQWQVAPTYDPNR